MPRGKPRQGYADNTNVSQETINEVIHVYDLIVCVLPFFDDNLAKVSQEGLQKLVNTIRRTGKTDVKGGKNAGILEVVLLQKDLQLLVARRELQELQKQANKGRRRVCCGDSVEGCCQRDNVGQRETETGFVPVARSMDCVPHRRLKQVLGVAAPRVKRKRIGFVCHPKDLLLVSQQLFARARLSGLGLIEVLAKMIVKARGTLSTT